MSVKKEFSLSEPSLSKPNNVSINAAPSVVNLANTLADIEWVLETTSKNSIINDGDSLYKQIVNQVARLPGNEAEIAIGKVTQVSQRSHNALTQGESRKILWHLAHANIAAATRQTLVIALLDLSKARGIVNYEAIEAFDSAFRIIQKYLTYEIEHYKKEAGLALLHELSLWIRRNQLSDGEKSRARLILNQTIRQIVYDPQLKPRIKKIIAGLE